MKELEQTSRLATEAKVEEASRGIKMIKNTEADMTPGKKIKQVSWADEANDGMVTKGKKTLRQVDVGWRGAPEE